MKIFKIIGIILLVVVLGFFTKHKVYQHKVDVAYSQLRIGMGKSEFLQCFKGINAYKMQRVQLYPGRSEEEMKSYLGGRLYDEVNPKDFFRNISFNGKCETYIYLIKKEYNFPNGWFLKYIFVIVDNDKSIVLGWGKDGRMGLLRDLF